ncbi:MAG TPA: response regulator transcription factor [Microlunatus sp.]
MTSVLVADDQELVRAGLLMLLSTHADLTVIGEVADGAQAVDSAVREHPDVVLMDLQMPVLSGTEATEQIVQRTRTDHRGPVRVLILTTFSDDDALYPALRAGASGYLLKHAAPQDLPSAIRAVASGQSWLDPRIAGKVMQRAVDSPADTAAGDGVLELLTPRELEILILMARGLNNGDIASHLVVSEATVKTHVSRVFAKTGARDRAQAVALAYQSGLLRS